MIAVYLNYPNKRFSIHTGSTVEEKQKLGKTNQRVIKININNLSEYFQSFESQRYKFKSSREYNDMWLEINLGNMDFEIAVAMHIVHLLGKKYKPFRGIKPKYHKS